MGLFPVLNTVFGLVPIFGHDLWLHGLTALTALYFGWMATAEAVVTHPQEVRAGGEKVWGHQKDQAERHPHA
jgi:hypothetical protein